MANINGTIGNDTLVGTLSADTINGKLGNDIITGDKANDTLTGGGGKDIFIYYSDDGTDTITDFGGVGKGTNPTTGVIAEVDTIQFSGADWTARNMLLTQNGTNLEITFDGVASTKVILQNFKLEDLDNLKASATRPAIGNILFSGEENTITDSFNVLDANSTETTIGIKNTVTFLNDLDNNITGLDNSDDVINGQGGNDKIDGLSGNDLLRGGAGNDTLIGGVGNDTLVGDSGNNTLDGGSDNDVLNLDYSLGNNTLNGSIGDDYLFARYSQGKNLLFGGDGNDYLSTSGFGNDYGVTYYRTSGNNTLNGGNGDDFLVVDDSTGDNALNGGAGDDYLSANDSTGDNLLIGGDGNDSLYVNKDIDSATISGNSTLKGGAGDDYFNARYSTGNNFLDGGDGNDSFGLSALYLYDVPALSSLVTQTVDGGRGNNDILYINYSYANGGITSAFNPTTNIGSITAGINRVNYKNIERLNITGTGYNDNIVGSNGNDELEAGWNGNDTIIGGEGDDFLNAGSNSTGNNLFNGGDGNDSLTASGYLVYYRDEFAYSVPNSGNSTLNGGAGNDSLSANYSTGKNLLNGGDGNDYLSVSAEFDYTNNTRFDSSGNNTLNGGAGGDFLIVNYSTGNNLLNGDDGNDYLLASGATGKNTLKGGNGNDTLVGGKGSDSLYGGAGTDIFAFNSFNEGVDKIYDFNTANEMIRVSAAGFGGGLSADVLVLQANQFRIGASATTNVQRFIYNSTTGALFFDQDGSAGTFAQVQFAQLSAGLALTNNHFVVV
ncbi:beta strand repeat-containing protein [Nostoc linckia]|uniref:beta strand repeat-containing protein n=1 Tax=Nostoc linckia TaxID=92942 RepID=UPI000BFFAE30|nr:calcium-binding protein [Nostoc linckia]